MKKKQNQSKENYHKAVVEVFYLERKCYFLESSFSSTGNLDPLLDGDELGVDDEGNPID